MQLLLLGLVLGIFVHDAYGPMGGRSADLGLVLTVMILPKLALAVVYAAGCVVVRRRLGWPGGHQALRGLDRLTSFYRFLAITLYGLDLWVGALASIRNGLGNLVLLDELLTIGPTLGLLVWSWWAYYPVDRRLREAVLMGRIDSGRPIYPIWSRGQYVLAQIRHQMALILAPMLLILAWIEAVQFYGPDHLLWIGQDPRPWLIIGGAMVVFLLAPLLIRRLWDTVPLPAGEIRDRLMAMCRQHRVGVRQLLLWRTFGGMINAAVMGLFSPLRYILLSDALLEMVSKDQVEAVMAHELAHVRKHHMFWLAVSAIGWLSLLQLTIGMLICGAVRHLAPEGGSMAGFSPDPLTTPTAMLGSTGGMLVWIAAFGWFCRRVERQADTFAVQHLASGRHQPMTDDHGRVLVDGESVTTMIRALQQVADLNHIPITRRSWRHGSIGWRQAYLRGLVGLPIRSLGIDRQMRWVKLATLGAIGLVIAASLGPNFEAL